jgi:hypothetical protein
MDILISKCELEKKTLKNPKTLNEHEGRKEGRKVVYGGNSIV